MLACQKAITLWKDLLLFGLMSSVQKFRCPEDFYITVAVNSTPTALSVEKFQNDVLVLL